MVDLLEQLFSVISQEEIVPGQWRDGLIVNIFKKGDREDPGNYRGITIEVTKGKLYGSRVSDHAIVHLGLNVSSSAHNCGCMVDGGNAMAAI